MKLVFIVGDAAVGKMSVGKELANQTGLKLFHNHVTIEPVLEVFGYRNKNAVNRTRQVFFEEFAKTDLPGLIFTMMMDFDNLKVESEYLDSIVNIFNKYNEIVDVYFIELDADQQTRLYRNSTPQRLEAKPSKKDVEISNQRLIQDDLEGRFISKDGEVEYSNFLRIVNDNLAIEDQVKLIRDTFNL